MSLTIGSLFSGIGGLELGLERAGLGPVLWQCELNPSARRVLEKHWPNVTRFDDVTQPRSYPAVDLICGGFPCQDVSAAGRGAGLSGARSGLWYHFAAIVDQVRPEWVVVENVTSGKRRWLPAVREQLCALGYETTAYQLSAADVGAPHLRRRIFVVAHAIGLQLREQPRRGGRPSREGAFLAPNDGQAGAVADPHMPRLEERGEQQARGQFEASERSGLQDDPWAVEPAVGRVAHGVPARVDRLKMLGNAVVPQCAEVIGRIVAAHTKGVVKP